jgi:hypothetical protein
MGSGCNNDEYFLQVEFKDAKLEIMMSTKSSTKVALVYPYFQTNSPNKRLFPPLGIATLASQLHNVGIYAHVFDFTFSNLESLISDLQSFNPAYSIQQDAEPIRTAR